MQIDRNVLEKIIGPVQGDDLHVSLFIISKKGRLKVLDLTKIDQIKLRQLINEERFAPVVETAEEISAYVNPKIASRLQEQEQNLAIEGKEGKKISIKTVSEEESKQLASIGKAFEEYLDAPEEEKENKEDESSSEPSQGTPRQALAIRQYLANNILLSDQTKMAYVIARFENVPGEIILDCLKRFNEEQRSEQKRKQEKAKLDDIQQTEIEKGIKRETIAKEQAFKQNQKKEILGG